MTITFIFPQSSLTFSISERPEATHTKYHITHVDKATGAGVGFYWEKDQFIEILNDFENDPELITIEGDLETFKEVL